MKKNRMLFKIISYILIQAFICLDLFVAGAVAKPVDSSTLAPAVSLSKIDLQLIVDEIVEDDQLLLELDGSIDLTKTSSECDDKGVDDSTSFEDGGGNNANAQTSSPGSGQNDLSIGINPENVVPPPETSVIKGIVDFAKGMLYQNPDDDQKKQLELFDQYRLATQVIKDTKVGDKLFTGEESNKIREAVVSGRLSNTLMSIGLFYLARQDEQLVEQVPTGSLIDFDKKRPGVVVFYDRFFNASLNTRRKALIQLIDTAESKGIGNKKIFNTGEISKLKEIIGEIDEIDNAVSTWRKLMESENLSLDDVRFFKKIEKIVLANTKFFTEVRPMIPKGSEAYYKIMGLDQSDLKGYISIMANTHVQNAVDLAVSSLGLNAPKGADIHPIQVDTVVENMIKILHIAPGKITSELRGTLHQFLKELPRQGGITLQDIYGLATRLFLQLTRLGFSYVDHDPGIRRAFQIRTHKLKKLREVYEEEPKNGRIYITDYAINHEETHVLLMRILMRYLLWDKFPNKETILDLFKDLMSNKYPDILMVLKFPFLIDEKEWRTQTDLIKQSLMSCGYDPYKPGPFKVLWNEAIPNYNVYLRLLKKENGNDERAVRTLAIATHFDIQMNSLEPGQDLDIMLDRTIEVLYPFLTLDQGRRFKKQVIELQAAKKNSKTNTLKNPRIMKEEQRRIFPINPSGGVLYDFAISAIFTSEIISSNQMNILPFGDIKDWFTAGAVVIGISAAIRLWQLPYFKSTRQRTIQLVNEAIKKQTIAKKKPHDKQNTGINKLKEFYRQAEFKDKKIILKIAAEQMHKRRNKINPEFFESFFMNPVKQTPESVINDIISSVRKGLRLADSRKRNLQSVSVALFEKKIEELGLNVNALDVIFVALNLTKVMGSDHFSDDEEVSINYKDIPGDESEYWEFYERLKNEIQELRMASVTALKKFPKSDYDVDNLEKRIKEYLRKKGTGITIPQREALDEEIDRNKYIRIRKPKIIKKVISNDDNLINNTKEVNPEADPKEDKTKAAIIASVIRKPGDNDNLFGLSPTLTDVFLPVKRSKTDSSDMLNLIKSAI